MSIEAEIEAAVSAFVAELMDLVRMAAFESVRHALGSPGEPAERPARRRATNGAPPRSKADSREATRPQAPASLRPRGSGPPTVRSFQVEPTAKLPIPFGKPVAAPAAPRFAPGVVVRRIPPKRRRDGRSAAPPPSPPPPPPPVEAGPTEPKKWVVVRRPARVEMGDPQRVPQAPPVQPIVVGTPASPVQPIVAGPLAPPVQPIVVGPPAPAAQPVAAPTAQPAPAPPETPKAVDVEAPTSKAAPSKPAKAPPVAAEPHGQGGSPASKSTAKGPASKRARTAQP